MIVVTTFATAAVASLVAAFFSVGLIESSSERGVKSALDKEGLVWAEVYTEGLQVFLAGTAPTEALRFKAISTAGTVVDAARVIDNMQVEATAAIQPPRFSIEILRNDSGISLIGLIPKATDREEIVTTLSKMAGAGKVTDLMETADYAVNGHWADTVNFALRALKQLPRSKISVSDGRIAITAMADSGEAKRKLEADLLRRLPDGVEMDLDISAPRPVITPFTLRFVRDETGPRFDACSADTQEARSAILAAAQAHGLREEADCTIGLGVPSPSWSTAVTMMLDGIDRLGGGSVTFADADITLLALEGTEQELFDRVVGELETSLPDLFALKSELPVQVEDDAQGPPEFTATLSPEGLVQLRGRLRDRLTRDTTESYARARFGSENTYLAARIDDTLPSDWPVRVLAGLDALALLANGAVTVTPDLIAIRGNTGNPDGTAEISRVLLAKLGESEKFAIDVSYKEKLDPGANLPKPEDCEQEIRLILSERKIQFEPGKATMDESAVAIMDDIAEILKHCGEIKLEIQGHTDSQGREEMNQALSQARAQSVINELRDRRVLTGTFSAKGYGETQPIADNETEEGREANRRIAFVLIRPKPIVEEESTLEQNAAPAAAAADAPQQDGDTPEEPAEDADAANDTTEDTGEAPASEEDQTDDQN